MLYAEVPVLTSAFAAQESLQTFFGGKIWDVNEA